MSTFQRELAESLLKSESVPQTVWIQEVVKTLGHIEQVCRLANFLTLSPGETAADKNDRIIALAQLTRLEIEAKRTFGRTFKRKRARKRGAAIRHRANAIFNQFQALVVGRMVDEIRNFSDDERYEIVDVDWAIRELVTN